HIMTGIHAFLEVLAGAGVRHLFGNPGSTELPLNDAVAADRRFTYVLGLQEVPVVAMADGYAMASGGVGVCNLHTACGLGNGMGMLYNAHRAGTPLVVTAGQQDRRLRFAEPVLEGDLVSVARSWTKWSAEVERAADVPIATRRAIQVARTPPTGPVFLSLPLDVQTEECGPIDLSAPHVPDPRARPPADALNRATELLIAARSPVILAGSRVTESGACAEVAQLAESLGAPVFAESASSHGRLPIRADHPLYRGPLPLWSPDVRAELAVFDVALCVGLNVLRLYVHRGPEGPIPRGLRLIHLDNVPSEIGKNYPVEVGLIGDPKVGLEELTDLVRRRAPSEFVAAAGRRVEDWSTRRARERSELLARFESERATRPMTGRTLMHALARVLPGYAAVVEEAPTTHQNLLERLGVLTDPTGHFGHRGWALGWGLGCSIGVKLAWPDRPVVALLGDGAALYGIQGLWSAAKYRVPVVFVISNNAQYKILKATGDLLPLPELAKRNYVAMDLTGPEVDFVSLSRSFGVDAVRVSDPDELSDRVRAALGGERPILLDVLIER
ncbi:MAG TPA: thiamine pyrophosphate-binding protein, partial [Gemmataceae bacterium]|nr:thiamine pyrophosphate-binding protein [Gemmataceae bacterium]